MAARCAALLASDTDAEPLYQRAITAHEGDGRPFEQARTRLLYGEWLRRNLHRASAREQLLAAAAAFARMAAAGGSNKQIGAQLFLSPRTVGFHLYKAFPKLGVTSRDELARYAP